RLIRQTCTCPPASESESGGSSHFELFSINTSILLKCQQAVKSPRQKEHFREKVCIAKIPPPLYFRMVQVRHYRSPPTYIPQFFAKAWHGNFGPGGGLAMSRTTYSLARTLLCGIFILCVVI